MNDSAWNEKPASTPSRATEHPGTAADVEVDVLDVEVRWQIYFFSFAASACELANGYDIGAFSFALLYFEDDDDLKLSPLQVAVLVGQYNLVCALGCLVAGALSDFTGRRGTLMGGNVLNIGGTLLFAFGQDFPTMFLGRFVMGFGSGITFMGPELYSCEMSPAKVRGFVSTFGEMSINFGILLGYLFGWLCQSQWRLMLALGAVIPAISLAMQFFIPESPRWLIKQKKKEVALAELLRTAHYNEQQLKRQVEEIEESIREEESGDISPAIELLWPSKGLQHAMLVGWAICFFQQANGSEGVVYFTPSILKMTGIEDTNTLYGCTAAVGACKACFVAIALSTMDTVGRRPLLLASSTGVAFAVLLLGIGFSDVGLGERDVAIMAVVALCMYMASFSAGWGPLTGVMLAEVFPLRIRGTAVGIGWAINRLVSGLVALTFITTKSAIGIGNTFLLYFVLCILALLFSWFIVPETNGVTLEQITHLFQARGATGKFLTTSQALARQRPRLVDACA